MKILSVFSRRSPFAHPTPSEPSVEQLKRLHQLTVQSYADELALPRNEYISDNLLAKYRENMNAINAALARRGIKL